MRKYTQYGILEQFSKAELVDMIKHMGLKGYSKLNKAETVDFVVEHFTTYMISILRVISDHQMDKFLKLLEGPIAINDMKYGTLPYETLLRLGIAGIAEVENQRWIVVGEEVTSAFELIGENIIMKQRQEKVNLKKVVRGCVNLYGVVDVEWVLALYNRYYGEVDSLYTYYHLLYEDMYVNREYVKMDEYLIHEAAYMDDRTYDALVTNHHKGEYYEPSKQELEACSEPDYFPRSHEVQRFEEYFMNHYDGLDSEMLEDIVWEICNDLEMAIEDAQDARFVSKLVDEYIVPRFEIPSAQMRAEIVQLLRDLVDHTRMWQNKGFMYSELRPAATPAPSMGKVIPFQRPGQKIGRNDPCPCGSGSKYKKCCMKN